MVVVVAMAADMEVPMVALVDKKASDQVEMTLEEESNTIIL